MVLKKYITNKYLLLLVASVSCFVLATLIKSIKFDSQDAVVNNAQQALRKKEKILNEELQNLASISERTPYNILFLSKTDYYKNLLNAQGIILLIYEQDTLRFWTDNSMALENTYNRPGFNKNIIKLKNGWFEVIKTDSRPVGTKKIVGLILLKKEYPYENKFLLNEFPLDFNLKNKVAIVLNSYANLPTLAAYDGRYLCSLDFSQVEEIAIKRILLNLFFNFTGIFLLITLLYELFFFAHRKGKGQNYTTTIYIGLLLLIRYLSLIFKFPEYAYELPLFSPLHYGDATSIWLQSLGDLLLTTIIILHISWIFSRHLHVNKKRVTLNTKVQVAVAIGLLLAVFELSRLLNNLLVGLIFNSRISYNIGNFFNLDVASYIALAIIAMLIYSFFAVSDKIIRIIMKIIPAVKPQLIIFFVSCTIHTVYCHLVGILDLVIILWPVFIFISIIVVNIENKGSYVFSGILIIISIIVFYVVHMLLKYADIKEHNNRIIYAEKLAAEQDPLAEHLFLEIQEKIASDTAAPQKLAFNSSDFEKELLKRHFTGYWEKYDVKIAAFDTLCYPFLNGTSNNRNNHDFYEDVINNKSHPTGIPNLYAVDNNGGRISYVSRIALGTHRDSTRTPTAFLYLELQSRFVNEEIGFPELLLDRKYAFTQLLSNYSYAKYKNHNLINKFGKYPYPLTDINFKASANNNKFETLDGYNHLVYRVDPYTLIVMSLKEENALNRLTAFSFVFAYFSLMLLLGFAIRNFSFGLKFSKLSFKYRIQLFLVLIVLLSLGLFGVGTIYYTQKQFEEKNADNIREKLQSVLIEAESKLGPISSLTSTFREFADFNLKRISKSLFTDINLYDVDGNLYASSRIQVFDQGLSSKKMNPDAFLNLSIYHKSEFIHDENIGKLNYLSAYVPIKNMDGNLIAFLNLPYFAKQNDLQTEISSFVAALINVYVFLLAFTIIGAIFIFNYLTEPLKLIQDKLSNLKLGKPNEPIEWKQGDEIGALVRQYNRMIGELAKSAEMLAKSERESAWREMAKQVAHEIKNPLTPMKLSIQHLERLVHDKSPDIDKKIERLSKVLIEQIDTLSTIATEFSTFAQMPKPNIEKLEIQAIIKNTIDLFELSPNIKIKLTKASGDEDMLLMADKDHLIRVFNNLIKNAIQAIPEGEMGLIQVSLLNTEDHLLITVQDNGTGIPDEQQRKIFAPNFTTKSSGMGLGLPMVKNIVESFNGKIAFTTQLGYGTSFFIEFPRYKG